MKYAKYKLVITIFLTCFYYACKEVGPSINLTENNPLPGDTTYMEQPAAPIPKNVVLEEFTGVRCVQCPEGHEKAKAIETAHPGRAFPVSIHTGFFAVPYPNQPDYKIPEGADIERMLGPQSYPYAAVNRKQFQGEDYILITLNKWENYTQQELNATSPVGLALEHTYNPTTRKLNLVANLKCLQTSAEPLHISAVILEDSIVGPQQTPQGVDSNYLHQHVLRGMLTPYTGLPVNAPDLNGGRVWVKNFEITLNPQWVDKHLQVVVFAHYASSKKDIIQAARIKL